MFFTGLTGVYANDYDTHRSTGGDDINQGVGNYDYMPYRANAGGSIAFHTVLSEYGEWVTVSRFGQVWRPYASADFRPFTNGHWVTTQSGQTWQGYEPWSWAADHYGNWIYESNYGWVWVPGTTYSPGRVAWSYGQDSIGWTPAPPYGYDYSQGAIGYRGGSNQFSFNDNSFGVSFNFSRQDNRYQSLFYNPAYMRIAPNLWSFVSRDRFATDNYRGAYFSSVRVQDSFSQHRLYISGRPLQRDHLERIIGRKVEIVPIRYQDLTIGGQRSHYVIPVGEEDHLRRNSRVVVDQVIAPGFAKRNKVFVTKNSDSGSKYSEKTITVENKNKIQTVQIVKLDGKKAIVEHQKIEKSGDQNKNTKKNHSKGKPSEAKHKKHP